MQEPNTDVIPLPSFGPCMADAYTRDRDSRGLSSRDGGDCHHDCSVADFAVSHMLVDPVHQHLFISSAASNSILVTDYSGQTVATIADERQDPGGPGEVDRRV